MPDTKKRRAPLKLPMPDPYMKPPYVPQAVTDVELAFPATVRRLMPNPATIPEEFSHDRTKWNRLFADAFYAGLESLKLAPKDGIDSNTAWRHVRAIMGSFEPKHEHKEAACAFLLSEWLEDAEWVPAKRKIGIDKIVSVER